ncbi:MAG: hypothetical protein QM831_34890 [Kofleriaceae bacterium]
MTVLLGGCIVTPDHEQVPLADQTRTGILVFPPSLSNSGISLYFSTDARSSPGDDPTDCPTAPSSLTATADGTALTLEETGGWDAPVDGTSACHQIRFEGSVGPNPTAGVITIADSSATWTITDHSFATFDDLQIVPSAVGTLAVKSTLGQTIDYVELTVTQGNTQVDGVSGYGGVTSVPITIAGDTATMPMTLHGNVTIAVFGRTISPVICSGPVTCDVKDPLGGTITATLP